MMMKYMIHDDIPEGIFNNFMKLEKIAVDTELHGLTMNRDQICLVQLCDQEEQVCLVRPKRNEGYSRLKALMENNHVLKVFHGIKILFTKNFCVRIFRIDFNAFIFYIKLINYV